MSTGSDNLIRREGVSFWLAVLLSLGMLGFIYLDGLSLMVKWWETREEYGHGYMIPFISLFLIWQKKDQLELMDFRGTWLGLPVVMFGLFLFYAGELSSIYTIIQYGFLFALYGITLSLMGWKAFKVILVPMLILFFMIPLPNFVFNNLSSELQLISSQLGVAVIRLFDISVYLEGNVIDLGVYQLQVVEACSGLNYLFPLMTLGFISAYFFTGAMWKKTVIFVSTVPITILMNSFRIGVIGVTVEYGGIEMAEGFLHDFEGWAVFMSCIGILILEMWLLARIGKDRLPLREAFGLDFPEPTPEDAETVERELPKPLLVAMFLAAIVSVTAITLPDRAEIIPDRETFASFPEDIDGWDGRKGRIEKQFLDVLKLTDYAMYDYVSGEGARVNFYSAYYESQRKGASAHSPRSCIPGGGWRITSLENHTVEGALIEGAPLTVNRLVIQKGDIKQLVYYWFQQRGRIVTNEYLVKWYLFLDSITTSRTDGALVRLTTVLKPGQDISIADERLTDFANSVSDHLTTYIPQ